MYSKQQIFIQICPDQKPFQFLDEELSRFVLCPNSSCVALLTHAIDSCFSIAEACIITRTNAVLYIHLPRAIIVLLTFKFSCVESFLKRIHAVSALRSFALPVSFSCPALLLEHLRMPDSLQFLHVRLSVVTWR